mmetsp:Transcript_15094/g.30140  ORF Transcript_15094/g.30140 Transcript_15094/m.30140 type:complete len:342 (-) Transcript_15094:150-1175(-)
MFSACLLCPALPSFSASNCRRSHRSRNSLRWRNAPAPSACWRRRLSRPACDDLNVSQSAFDLAMVETFAGPSKAARTSSIVFCLGGATSGGGAAGSDDGICATFGVAKTEGGDGRGGGAGRGRKSVTAVPGVKSLSERNPVRSHSSCFPLRFMASRTSFLATSTSPNTSDKIRTRRRANRRRNRDWSDPASGGILRRRRRDARRAGALHEHRIRFTSSRRDPAATAFVLGPVWSDTPPSGGDISPTGRGFITARPSAAGSGIHQPAGSTGARLRHLRQYPQEQQSRGRTRRAILPIVVHSRCLRKFSVPPNSTDVRARQIELFRSEQRWTEAAVPSCSPSW